MFPVRYELNIYILCRINPNLPPGYDYMKQEHFPCLLKCQIYCEVCLDFLKICLQQTRDTGKCNHIRIPERWLCQSPRW
jgi:hypothetical protein